jgi:hypothetical protein
VNSRTIFVALLTPLACSAVGSAAPNVSLPNGPGEAAPMFAGAGPRAGNLVWDQGAPDLVNGQEATIANEAEDFVLITPTTLTSARFWTIESIPGFDGSFQWAIHADGGGEPGAFITGGAAGLSRLATGRTFGGSFPEYENAFTFPGGIELASGSYFLVIHMSADCGTRDEVYWETTAVPSGATARNQGLCFFPWSTEGYHLAFQLFGKPTCDPPDAPNNPLPQNGSADVPTTTILSWNNLCNVAGVTNGGFEAGTFAGWNAVTNIPPGGFELTAWNVSTGGTGYFDNAFPAEGSFYAQHGFDGTAGVSYELHQEVFVPPAASTVLTWRDRVQRDSKGIPSTLPRLYRVTIQPAGGGAPLAVIHSEGFPMNGVPYTDTGYRTHNVDLAPLDIAGQVIRIHWSWFIPENFTGPAQFEIDGIELDCEADGPSHAPPVARRAAADEAFAAKAAMYQAVKGGEFRSPAEAMASGRFNPPASRSAIPVGPAGEREPFVVAPARGLSGLVFDGGAPDLAFGNEMTAWLQAEDFDAAHDSNVHFVRFWTLELAGFWDGDCQITFHPDVGGAPGAAYFGALGNLVSRAPTGRSAFALTEFEYTFAIPGGTFVPQGRNWLGLHMSSDCATRDEVYWESTNFAFGAFGHEDGGCDGGPSPNFAQHAFQLYGEDAECPVTYDVYLRRLPDGLTRLVCERATLPECDPGPLTCDTGYEWFVVAFNPDGITQGPTWTFRTAVCCCPGDSNGDRTVNFADITKVLEQWLSTCP